MVFALSRRRLQIQAFLLPAVLLASISEQLSLSPFFIYHLHHWDPRSFIRKLLENTNEDQQALNFQYHSNLCVSQWSIFFINFGKWA